MRRLQSLALILILIFACHTESYSQDTSPTRVLPGIDVLLRNHSDIIQGQRLGLITNRTGLSVDGRSTIDLLTSNRGWQLVALFSPEHGIRGDVEAGQSVGSGNDEKTGLPVHSLYGKTLRPTDAMLQGIDILLYDIQDIGVRSYTYISTMGYCMEACARLGITFIVLDRPDPLGGGVVDGPVLDSRFISFVGPYEMPWVYGMTPGEVARWIRQNRIPSLDLKVIPMEGWKRGMTYDQTGLRWTPPSPNVPYSRTPFYYAITGAIGELGTLSEGVGTDAPFELVGAPWIDANEWVDHLNGKAEAANHGARFKPLTFTPSKYGFKGVKCHGVRILIDNPLNAKPAAIMLDLSLSLQHLYPDRKIFESSKGKARMFDKVFGFAPFRNWIQSNYESSTYLSEWQKQVQRFEPGRRKALIYP